MKKQLKKKCFVIMPFSRTQSCTKQKWTEIFERIIKPAVEESRLGYECERFVAKRGNIIKGILEGLSRANVVIADLTDNNPNVFYELGVRHTWANRTILIAQGAKHIPFDLRPYAAIFYRRNLTKVAKFKKDMKKILQDIERDPERPDNPVADFRKERNIVLFSAEKSANVKKLNALITELSFNITAVDRILDAVKQSQQIRSKDKSQFRVSNKRLSNTCLELLLSTSYIILTEELLNNLNSANEAIKVLNRRLDLWGAQLFAENVEQALVQSLPLLKKFLTLALKVIIKLGRDYQNDNYQEPKEPTVLVSSPEHQKYIEATK
jgi:hypothetical protein